MKLDAKEKAVELVEFFMNLRSVKLSDYSRIEWPTAKQCALICVDEMEKALTEYGTLTGELQNMDSEWRYLQEVRQEIENL